MTLMSPYGVWASRLPAQSAEVHTMARNTYHAQNNDFAQLQRYREQGIINEDTYCKLCKKLRKAWKKVK